VAYEKRQLFLMTQRRIYQDKYPYFITYNTKNNYPFFADIKKAKLLYKIILISSKKKFFLPYIFSILNNHIHMLVKFLEKIRKKLRAKPLPVMVIIIYLI